MLSRILFLSSLIFIIQSFQTQAQNATNVFLADSVFIYTDYKFHGTTADLKQNFNYLDSSNANKTRLSKDDVIKLSAILNDKKVTKLLQQKYGGEICYLIIYYNGNKMRYVTSTSTKIGILDDLDRMKQWKIKVPEEAEEFKSLIKKYWQ